MTSVEVHPEIQLSTQPRVGSPQRYRTVWRWHFYAGLFVAPVLLVLAVTGAIYLFKEPFEEWHYSDVRTLTTPVTSAQPLSRQIAAAQTARPGAAVMSVIPPTAPDRSTRVILRGADSGPWAQGISVYVDPGTLKVLGQIDDSATFMRVVRTVHGELMSGTVGDRVVETAACWSLILTATGVYLWWRGPARRRGPKSGRSRLRRLHALTGTGAGVVIVFLVLSGLPWSGFWGDNLQRVQEQIGSTTPDDKAYARTSTIPTGASSPGDLSGKLPGKLPGKLSGELSDNPAAKVPWAAERLPVPASEDGGHAGHGGHGDGVLQAGALPVEQALASAKTVMAGCAPPDCVIKILLPDGPQGVYTFVSDPLRDPAAAQTVHVDQYSGRPLVSYGWQQYGLVSKVVELGIALHEGRRYGTANLIVMLSACLALITLTVTGVWMWWKRRPRGRVGAPARPTDRRTAYGVIVIMAVLGLLFPLAGITMLAVLLLDWLVLRRVKTLRGVFG